MESVRKLILICLAAVLLEGCASEWTLRSEQASSLLQWPKQPAMSRITYASSVKGFERSSAASSTIKRIAFGLGGDNNMDSFNVPVAVAAGRDGRLAVADTGCGCVHLYFPSERKYLRVTSAATVELKSPVSVMFDDGQRLYVSDSMAAKVFVYDVEGAFLFAISGGEEGPFKRPTGLAYNRDKKLLYVVDTLDHKIHVFDTAGKPVFSFGARGSENGQFNFPTHIAWAPPGSLYVTDAMNFRLQMFDDMGGFRGAFGHHGDVSGDFAMPKGVAVDKDGIIYVVDSLFDNIQMFNSEGDFLLTVGSRGRDFGEFWMPSGIFIDDTGKLFLCDTYNQRIQLFQITQSAAHGN